MVPRFLTIAALLAVVLIWSGWILTASTMPDAVRIPPISPRPAESALPPAIFRHGTHAQFVCYACHPTLFPQHPKGFTHAEMSAGAYCGACHNGAAAFAVQDAQCQDCHVAR